MSMEFVNNIKLNRVLNIEELSEVCKTDINGDIQNGAKIFVWDTSLCGLVAIDKFYQEEEKLVSADKKFYYVDDVNIFIANFED